MKYHPRRTMVFGACTICGDRGELDEHGHCLDCQPCPECGGHDCPLDKCLAPRCPVHLCAEPCPTCEAYIAAKE